MDEKLTALLTDLAQTLGTTVENLYKVLVKQAKLDFYILLLQVIVLLPLFFPLMAGWHWVIPRCVPADPHSQYDHDWPANIQIIAVGLGMTSVAWGILAIAGISSLISTGITNLLNPEARAIDKVLYAIKK